MNKFDIGFRSIIVLFCGFMLYQQHEIKTMTRDAFSMADMAAQSSNATRFHVEMLKGDVENYMTMVSQEEATKIVETRGREIAKEEVIKGFKTFSNALSKD
mgnify:CR=1 FL=1